MTFVAALDQQRADLGLEKRDAVRVGGKCGGPCTGLGHDMPRYECAKRESNKGASHPVSLPREHSARSKLAIPVVSSSVCTVYNVAEPCWAARAAFTNRN